jgi:hypothetical protein
MTWNSEGLLTVGKELALSNLLAANKVDIMAVTEVEIPASAAPFSISGYVTFSPTVKPGEKTRVLLLVRDSIALESNSMPRLDIMEKSSTSSLQGLVRYSHRTR